MAKKAEPRDHIDTFLETIHHVLPDLDLEVEGIVDRIGGLARRFNRFVENIAGLLNTSWQFGADRLPFTGWQEHITVLLDNRVVGT